MKVSLSAVSDRALRAADALAELCLSGKFDKQGKPLIDHVRRVAAACAHLSPEQHIAALLHDCIEDGGLDEHTIAAIFGQDVALLVEGLTRRPGEPYLERYIAAIPKLYPEAVPIKLADLADNLDPARGPIPDSLRRRYKKAREILSLSEWTPMPGDTAFRCVSRDWRGRLDEVGADGCCPRCGGDVEPL